MKKIFISVLALTMCLSMLVACKPSDNNPAETTSTPDTTTSVVVTTEEPKEPTKFELQFSVENEKLLSEVINNVESGSVLTDVPKFSTKETSRVKAGNAGYTYIYEKASLDLYNAYCDNLSANNFAQYTETEFNAEKTAKYKNYFTTFISKVSQVDIEFHAAQSLMYVTHTPRTASVLPEREAPEYTEAGANYPTMVTQLGHEDIEVETSLGLIIRLADGSFVLYDSGHNREGIVDRIYETLVKQAPDPDNIVISAWIITHGHGDHTGAFMGFTDKYAKASNITLKQIVYNFPDSSILDDGLAEQNTAVKKIKAWGNDVEILKPHTGNVLYYADVKFNVLYTQENYLAVSNRFGNYNTSSLVLQMVTKDGTKILLAADHPVSGVYQEVTWCEGALYNWYGDFIESYVSTTFHHGLGGGADTKIYYTIKPKIVLWCVTNDKINKNNMKQNTFNEYFAGPSAASKNKVTYYIAGDNVQVLTFANGVATVKEYDSFAAYKNS